MQDRRDRRLPVRPGPAQVLAAALGADHELGRVAHALVLLADGHEVVDLLLGDGREVADLAEAVGVGLGLEDLDRAAHDLGDRPGAVVVAHDPAGAAGRSAADAALVEHHHVGAALGQAPATDSPLTPPPTTTCERALSSRDTGCSRPGAGRRSRSARSGTGAAARSARRCSTAGDLAADRDHLVAVVGVGGHEDVRAHVVEDREVVGENAPTPPERTWR